MLQQDMTLEAPNGKAKVPAEPVFLNQNTAAVRRAKAWLDQRIDEAKKLPKSQLFSEVVTVTPALAELILLEHNTGNRAIRPNRVDRWTDTIKEGRMKLTSQGLSFARDGNLNNGQHRLTAIVAAGRPVVMNAVFGEERECFDILDTGANRTGGDALRIAGYEHQNTLASGARLYTLIKNGQRHKKSRVISNDILRATVEAHPGLAGSVPDARRILRKTHSSSAAVVAALYIIKSETYDADRLDDFITQVVDGSNLKKGGPILILRDGLTSKAFGAKYSTSEHKAMAIAAAIVNAWNLWVTGKRGSMRTLNWTIEESFPEVE